MARLDRAQSCFATGAFAPLMHNGARPGWRQRMAPVEPVHTSCDSRLPTRTKGALRRARHCISRFKSRLETEQRATLLPPDKDDVNDGETGGYHQQSPEQGVTTCSSGIRDVR